MSRIEFNSLFTGFRNVVAVVTRPTLALPLIRLVGLIWIILAITSATQGQTVGAPQTTMVPIQPYPDPPTFSAPSAPNYGGTFGGQSGFFGGNSAPRIRLGTGGPMFDPYSSSGSSTVVGPSSVYPSAPGGALSSGNSGILGRSTITQPPSVFGGSGGGLFGSSASNGGGSIFGSGGSIFGGAPSVVPSDALGGTGFGNSIYPPTAIPNGSPSTLFPGGIFQGNLFSGGTIGSGNTVFRLLQGPRLRHTYIHAGDDVHDLAINETDVSLAFAFPNFLTLGRPLFVVPSFSLHLWDGPRETDPFSPFRDLPANAYSAFLDFGWQSDPNQMLGLELGLRVGAFTDFDTFNSDSIRVLGKALGSFRLTPFTTFKLGVHYLDRNRVKILPAGGFLYQPNAYSRFDIFFPQPKIARYWRTFGTRDVWWYFTGDYGGGSWTIQRSSGEENSIDINDIRVMFGLEWGLTNLIRVGRRSGFMEIGYVFDREVIYKERPVDDFKPDDAVMFRIGFGY